MSTSHEVIIYQQCNDVVERYANCILRDFNKQNEEATLNTLASYVLHYSNAVEYNKVQNKIFDEFAEMVDSSPEELSCDNVLKDFKEQLDTAKKSVLENGKKCEKYKNFMELIAKREVEADEEITAVSQSLNLIDPITKLPIKEPVKNKACGHVYEKSSILKLIERNPKTKCPIAGCSAKSFVKKSDLISDNMLKRMLSNQCTDNS